MLGLERTEADELDLFVVLQGVDNGVAVSYTHLDVYKRQGVEDTIPAMESTVDVTPEAPRLVVSPLVGEEVAAFSVDELKYNLSLIHI